MKSTHFMALDVHCEFCHMAWASPGGKVHDVGRVPTRIPALIEAIGQVPRPRTLVMEEGPLAGWLSLNLREHVDRLIASDPWRNHLISQDGDKSDQIDAAKLLTLARNGGLREVHQMDTEGKLMLKQHVSLYHDTVRERVKISHRAIWHLRRWGVMAVDADLADSERRATVLAQLPQRRTVLEDIEALLESYDMVRAHVHRMRHTLSRLGAKIPMIRRLVEVPGIGPVRAASFYVYVDAPGRFRKKQALWKYMGIGLEKRQSGNGPVFLGVPRRCNRVLKNVILGAAESAATRGNNPFADAYRKYLQQNQSPRIARRSVARLMATVLWGMSKNSSDYRPDWVGVQAKALDSQP